MYILLYAQHCSRHRVRFHRAPDARAPSKNDISSPVTNRVGVRSFDSFIPCAQDRVSSSAPSRIAVTDEDSSDFCEPTEYSHPRTVEGCTRTGGTDYHLDLVETEM